MMWRIKTIFLLHSLSVLAHCAIQSQTDLDNLAAGLKVKWKVVTNTKVIERYDVEITVQLTAPAQDLSNGPWQLHLDSIFMIEPDWLGNRGNGTVELPGQGLKVTHMQGSHFYFEPTADFLPLSVDGSKKIRLKIRFWSVARTDSMPNWYLTYPNLRPVVIASTQGEDLAYVAERTTVQQWKRYDYDAYNPYTAQERYERNYIADATYDQEVRVIPSPAHVKMADASERRYVTIEAPSWTIGYVGIETKNEADYLKAQLGIVSTVPNDKPGPNVISLKVGEVDVSGIDGVTNNSEESYQLDVDAASQRISIVGQGSAGVFYGIVTLLSLMTNGQVPECTIVDSPRFEYRGLMLDLARSFKSKEDVMTIIELMSRYKMNRLHLHLSDDEGWRLEVPKLPELTQMGSQRCHDPTETVCLMPQLGSGPDNSTAYGSGYLTTADYLDILQLAVKRHVIVVPEIDMPGHARAAIKSMELRAKKLADLGSAEEGLATLLAEPDDPSVYTTPQIYFDNAVNPCMNSTYTFIGIVMDRFIELHDMGGQPLNTFHYGGDEVGPGAWLNSTNCQALRDAGVLPENSPKGYFLQRVAELAAERNLSIGAWEDGLIQPGNIPFNLSTIPVTEAYAYAWDNVWEYGTLQRTYRLANEGYKVVMTHASHMYFDHPYEPDPEERGFYWATRFTDTRKTFSYNAVRYYDNVLTRGSGQPITDEELCGPDNASCPVLTEPQNIAGIEATLFSETTRTREHLHDRLFPRVLAVAERAWHKAKWEEFPKGAVRDAMLNEDWFSFARAIGYREIPRLESDVAYRIPPPGAKLSFGYLLTTPLYPGLVVQYSLDSGTTWTDVGNSLFIGDYRYRIWLRTRSADSSRNSRTVVLDPEPRGMLVNQPVIDYISQYLAVEFTVLDNYQKYGDAYFEAKIKLTNTGSDIIPGGNWRVYFTSVNVVEPDTTLQGRQYVDHSTMLTIAHEKGYLYSFGPSVDFRGIDARESVEFVFRIQYWSVSRYEQMPRWYVSAAGMNAKDLVYTESEELAFVTPFTKPQQWKRTANDKFDPWTPAARYDRNAGWAVGPLDDTIVIPTPLDSQLRSGQTLSLLEGQWTVVNAGEELETAVQYLQDMLSEVLPNINLTRSNIAPSHFYIRFQISAIEDSESMEAYRIDINPEANIIEITSSASHGAFYAAVTLIHLAVKASPAGSLRDTVITDAPRFPYRGMYVDTARNFMPKESIIKLLDIMALYKLNKLHFHLCDDEGWRLEIPGLEELTQLGGRRCHDPEESECIMSTLGSGAGTGNSGSGFYNVSEYRDILRHAKSRNIEVIPEFDMPGHAHAAIRAMRLRKKRMEDMGNFNDSDMYLLDATNDPSHYFSVQYYTDNAINPCIESTFNFIQELFTQVKEMHRDIQPLKVYHFGGDEVAPGAWVNSSYCVPLLKSGVNLKEEFTRRVSNITRDITLAAWEDGLTGHDSIPWERSSLANEELIAFAWQNVWEWGLSARAHNLANAGYKVVFSPVTHTYLDHPQEPSPEERGFYWGTRYTDAFKTFSFMPMHFYMNADIERSGEPVNMTQICKEDGSGCPKLNRTENIIGMQGQLWSETVRLPEQFQYMVFPRLLALAERVWHQAQWEGQSKEDRQKALLSDWARFARNLGSHDLALLDKLGVAYRVPPPGARQNGNKIRANVEYPGLKVQYKVQGSEWAELTSSKTFSNRQEVTLRTVSANGQRYSSEIKLIIMINASGGPKDTGDRANVSITSTILCACVFFITYYFM